MFVVHVALAQGRPGKRAHLHAHKALVVDALLCRQQLVATGYANACNKLCHCLHEPSCITAADQLRAATQAAMLQQDEAPDTTLGPLSAAAVSAAGALSGAAAGAAAKAWFCAAEP